MVPGCCSSLFSNFSDEAVEFLKIKCRSKPQGFTVIKKACSNVLDHMTSCHAHYMVKTFNVLFPQNVKTDDLQTQQ